MSESQKLLDEKDRERVLLDFNRTARSFPAGLAHEFFERQVLATPDAVAVRCGAAQLSYAALNARANRIAAWLLAQGLSPGTPVGLHLARSTDLIAGLIGIAKSGGCYLPIDPEAPPERIQLMLADAAAPLLLTDTANAAKLDGLTTRLLRLDTDEGALAACSPDNPGLVIDPESPLYLIYTSGSSGKPKGTLVPQRGPVNQYLHYIEALRFGADSRSLIVSSIGFDLTQRCLWAPLMSGGLVVLPDSAVYDAELILDLIQREAISHLTCTPSAFYPLLDDSANGYARLAPLKQLALGGERVLLSRLADWRASEAGRSVRISNCYGPTEASANVALFHWEAGAPAPGVSLPIGRPIANTQLYVLDAQQQPVALGEEGELCIAGTGVALGYLHRPEQTAAVFLANPFDSAQDRPFDASTPLSARSAQDRPFDASTPLSARSGLLYRSGDQAVWRADGLLEYRGRIDQQVKLRGYRIELAEIEAVIAAHPAVKQAVVLLRQGSADESEARAERSRSVEGRLAAYLVLHSGMSADAISLRAAAAQRLPDYMLPSAWTFLDALPLNVNGKLDRKALPAPGQDRPPLSVPHVAPGDALQKLLATLWEELLDVKGVGIDDPFFELGGSSLKLVQLLGKLSRLLGVRLGAVGFFAAPTIRRYSALLRVQHRSAIARHFSGEGASPLTPHASRLTPHPSPLTPHPSSLTPQDSIAIIGMACRLPGAPDLARFWQNLVEGVESIRPLSDEELDRAGVSAEQRAHPDYVRMAPMLADADCFDAAFFGYTPREAALMDPQIRLLHETSWAALEDAGIAPARAPARTGVFNGVARNSYLASSLATNPETRGQLADVQITFGNDKDYAATRIAHKLDLKGPALTAQTACSTGGVLLHLARRSLLAGECDLALVGGARVVCPLGGGYRWEEGSFMSRDGHMQVFDETGTGMIRGSGVVSLVLKRQADAQRDGDRIYALLKGSALNNDGSDKLGYTAPSVSGQAAVIAAALADAGVGAASIGYVEAHGTATRLGDPIELEGLSQVYRQASEAVGFCRIGSVKSNIGHLDPAAALASIAKTALALTHERIPASLHYQRANPQLDFSSSPFVVNASLSDWPRVATPRRAGVSAFGIGGTNFHGIFEEAPPQPASGSAPQRDWQLLKLSAKTEDVLKVQAANLAQYFAGQATASPAQLADAAHTLDTARSRFAKRGFVLARTAGEASERLRGEGFISGTPLVADPRLIWLFPGQGAQHLGMGRQLYKSEPVFRAAVDRCAEILLPALNLDLREILYPSAAASEAAASALRATQLAQPAIFTISYATAKLWQSFGLQAANMIGHSVGEFVAATLAGVFELEHALLILAERARLMQAMPAGGMLAVRLGEPELLPYLGEGVALAAINSPALCVVSGAHEKLDALNARLQAAGVGATALHTSHAFHSEMMEPVSQPFAAIVGRYPRRAPQRPFHSSLTGLAITAEQAQDPQYWAQQLRNPVRFAPALLDAAAPPGGVFLECGPGQNLATSARQTLKPATKAVVIASLPHAGSSEADDAEHFFTALGRLYCAGIEAEAARSTAGETRLRISLPTYAFARSRHWIEPGQFAASDAAVTALNATSAAALAAPLPAADDLHRRTVNLLAGITGIEFSSEDEDKSFLELGMDSLVLTQVAGKLKNEFRLELRFRQLLEELTSIRKLVEYLKRHASILPVAQAPSPDGNVAPGEAAGDGAAPATGKAFGAAVRIQTASNEVLSRRQRKSLDALIARTLALSGKSRAAAQQHRSYFADPRTVSGFRPLWKELVYPIVSTRSEGPYLWDLDGQRYIDTVNGFGATLFGHKPAFVNQAIAAQLEKGYEVGPIQEFIGEAAKLFTEMTRTERVAFCNTGSEAVTAAVRCARTVTGRDLVVSFANDYHGIQDEVIVRAGPKGRGLPAASGIPFSNTASTLILDYGDPKSLEVIRARAGEIAAIMIEPVQSRNLDLQPREFIHECRRIADAAGCGFIMDEVILGFRVAPGGAQEYFGVSADLVSYGKVFGGGLPVGAVAGKARFMDALDGGAWRYGDNSKPEAGVTYFAGTFVRHPLTMAAVLSCLRHMQAQPSLQAQLNARVAAFVERLRMMAAELQAPIRFPHFSSVFRLEWTQDEAFGELYAVYLRERGLHTYDHRLQIMTTAHTDEVLDQMFNIYRDALIAMQRDGLLGRIGEPVKMGGDVFDIPGGIFYQPPVEGARLGRDAEGNPAWFVADSQRAGQYLQIGARA